MPETTDILPCPFCGSAAKAELNESSPPELEEPYWDCGCHNRECPAVGPLSFGETEEEAIRNWNTRAPSLDRETLALVDRWMSGNEYYEHGVINHPEAPQKSPADHVRQLLNSYTDH